MNVLPEATYEAIIDTGETGLVGTIGTRLDDNTATTITAFDDTDIVEIADGVYAAIGRVAPDTLGQYTLIWTDGVAGDVLGVEDLYVTTSSDNPIGTPSGLYASTTELARILKIRAPSTEQTAAMVRVLVTATLEINAEIDLADDADPLTATQVLLCSQVCLDRAADLWHHTEAMTGVTGMLGDLEGTPIEGRYSWNRYAHRLAPVKSQWGLA